MPFDFLQGSTLKKTLVNYNLFPINQKYLLFIKYKKKGKRKAYYSILQTQADTEKNEKSQLLFKKFFQKKSKNFKKILRR